MSAGSKYMLSRRQIIRNGLMTSASLVEFCRMLPQAEAQPSVAGDPSSWTIGNLGNGLQRTITFHPERGIRTEALTAAATGSTFITPSNVRPGFAAEFSFRCNGAEYRGDGAGFRLLGAEETAVRGGRSLQVRLHHPALSLDVDVAYRSFDGQPAIRKHVSLRNQGTGDLLITHLCIEAVGLWLGPANETVLNTQYGSIPREIFYTGRSEDAAILVSNSRTGNGMAVISEVPGYMKRTEVAGWDDPSRVRVQAMYDTDLMPFERTLKPGQIFQSAAVSLVAFSVGKGFNDPKWVLPSFAAKVLVKKIDAQGPPWIYNTWEPFERTINEKTTLESIEVAGTIGMDVFTIDDGWQKEYGDNEVNRQSFPHGLEPIIEAIERAGMRLGLWIPLAAISTTTAEYRNNTTFAARDQQGHMKMTSTMSGDQAVMCLASGFRDLAAARLNDVIERFRAAYLKLDLTTIFNAYGESPGCAAEGHDHATWAESLNMIYEGIAYVAEKVYARHPGVLLDLTFELWGQKHVIDAGLLRAGDLDWLSNVEDKSSDSAGPIQARQLLYQRAVSMPVESMLIGNMHAGVPSIAESFATAIGSAPLLLGDLRKLSSTDRLWLKSKIAWFKALRHRVRISESFFPLGSWNQTTADRWDGFARLARTGEGIIVLFRNHSKIEQIDVCLQLIPPGRFKARSVITGVELGVFTTAMWAQGVRVTFAGESTVEVLEVSALP